MMAAGMGLAVAVGVAGCGEVQKQLTAKDQVTNALANFDTAKSATFTMKLAGTPADVEAIAKAEGEPLSASERKALAQVLAGDVVVSIAAPEGKTLGDLSKSATGTAAPQDLQSLLGDPQALGALLEQQGSSAIAVNLGGASLAEVRSIDGLIYVRADAKKILTLAGEDPAAVDRQLDGLPPSLAPLAKAVNNEWVSIDLVKAATAAKEGGLLEALPTPTATPSIDAAKVQRLIASLKAAYQQKATISELGEAGERGTGYRLSAPAKQVAQAVSDDLIAIAGKGSEAQIRKGINGLPDQNVALDLWVKDDRLTAVALDITQFLDKPANGKKLSLDVGINVDSGEVTAPTGATEFDVKAFLDEVPLGAMGGLGGAAGAGAGAGDGSAGAAPGEISDAQMKELKKQTGLSEKEIEELMEQSAQ